jgi:hypothetical protein
MTTFCCLRFEIPPQPGGPGPRTCFPREQGGPVITPGTGCYFRRLLRPSWLRWKYSNPLLLTRLVSWLYNSFVMDRVENTVSNSSSIVARRLVAMGNCLFRGRYLVTVPQSTIFWNLSSYIISWEFVFSKFLAIYKMRMKYLKNVT